MGSLEAFTIAEGMGCFSGTIDEVRVWDRVLSEWEVAASHEARPTSWTLPAPAPLNASIWYQSTAHPEGVQWTPEGGAVAL